MNEEDAARVIATLAAALDYYARHSNYYGRTNKGHPRTVNILTDRGERARKALKETGLIRR